MVGIKESESRSSGLHGEKPKATLLGVLPVVDEDVLLSKDYSVRVLPAKVSDFRGYKQKTVGQFLLSG